MMSKISVNRNFSLSNKYYAILFIAFPVIYFLLYGSYGYNDADDGYTLAVSWRIFNGEIPYKDFIMVRPPMSPLFHSLTLFLIPENYQIIFERFLCFELFALSSLFASLAIDKVFNLKTYNINPYLLAIVGFVFSVSNFPPTAWHTVDGVFFASFGIFLLVRFSNIYMIIFGMLLLFFSALCKQSFYLMPFAGIAYIALIHKNWIKSIVSIISLLIFVGLFVFILSRVNAVQNFMELTSGSTKIADLIKAGVSSYFSVQSIYFLAPFAFWFVAHVFFDKKRYLCCVKLIPFVFITLSLLYPLAGFCWDIYYSDFNNNIFGNAAFEDTAKILFILSMFLFISRFEIDKKWFTLYFLTILSWCAGISWGCPSPVMYSTPLVFSFLLISQHYFKVKNLRILIIYTFIMGTITYFIAYQKPQLNTLRKDLDYDLSDIFPKLKYIKVGKLTHEKYHDLSRLIEKYGNNFKTLPDMPLSNYLSNTNSPIQLDWVFNAETNNQSESVINRLSENHPIVFIEKKPLMKISNSDLKFHSKVTYYIQENWTKIESTMYFDVYKLE